MTSRSGRSPEAGVQATRSRSVSGMKSLTPLVRCRVEFYDLVVGFGASERNQPGQAALLLDLRGRVSTWPPQRLTRLRCERESVSVVSSPGEFLESNREEQSW